MKYFWLMGIVLVLMLLSIPVVSAQSCDFSGDWTTKDGNHLLILDLSGDKVTGSWDIFLANFDGSLNGNTVNGRYSDDWEEGDFTIEVVDCNSLNIKLDVHPLSVTKNRGAEPPENHALYGSTEWIRPSALPNPPSAVLAGMENNVDRPGNDYMNFDLTSPDPTLCKQACDDDPNCKAFTYVRPGFQGTSARCWLKNIVPSEASRSCCISGVKEEVANTQLLDHALASSVDESTYNVITRTNEFSTTDSNAYSWLSLGNARAGTVEWRWYSPDGNLYHTGSVDIPEPSGARWSVYNVWYHIPIAEGDAANLPGNWNVDVYLYGQKLLTEQFTIGTSGSIGISASPSIVSSGETIAVTYSGAPGSEYDWIAIFKVGDPNTSYGDYYYLNKQQSGTLTFIAPSTPGEYEFRLFGNWPEGGYNDLARSNIIMVTG